MKRSTERILTTHAGRLPNPDNIAAIQQARADSDQATFDRLVKAGVTDRVRKQMELRNDIHSDGEFWKARDEHYYNSRVTGVAMQPLQPGEGPSILVHQQERHMPEFREFYEIYDQLGNIPRPGVVNPQSTYKAVITGPMTYKGQDAIKHELEVVKAGIAETGAQVEDFFFPVLGPGWLGHFLFNAYYPTDEEYVYAMAAMFKGEYEAVVEAGFILQIDDPGLADKFGMFYPPIPVEAFRKHADLRIEATNWALRNIPEDRVRYHTCWGSWHTPHTTDIPFKHIVDLMLKVNAQAYSVEAADVRHELDYKVWEDVKFPQGKIYIPGVIAHKTTTIEPPELVAHRIMRYASIMGRENVIAGTDCGYGNRVYPDIAWAKMKAMAEGAALATQQLWPRSR
jgi:5-methyltetrahydropteroyltriglutamate--homocysteine methyltransferase